MKRTYTKQEKREYAERCSLVEESFVHTAIRDGVNYRAHCPFCVSSKTGQPDYSLDIEAHTGLFNCHRCNVGGRLRNAPDPSAQQTTQEEYRHRLPSEFYLIGEEPGLSSELMEPARRYARGRYVSEVRARELGVGAAIDGWYGGRVIVPFHRVDGEFVGFVSRDYTGLAADPYLYSKKAVRSEFVFNANALYESTCVPLIVVEGVFDATPFWPHAVPQLGKLTDTHKEELLKVDRPIALCPDGDAWREGRAHALWLRYHGKSAGLVRLPAKKDPDELVEEVWEAVIGCTDEEL